MSSKVTSRCGRGRRSRKRRLMGSPPWLMLRRMVRRRSTCPRPVLIRRRRASRRAICRNRRNAICSSASTSACCKVEKSALASRSRMLAPATAWTPSCSDEASSPEDPLVIMERAVCTLISDRRVSRTCGCFGVETSDVSFQNAWKHSSKRSQSSMEEQRTDRSPNLRSSVLPGPSAAAASSAPKVSFTLTGRPRSRAKRQNSTIVSAVMLGFAVRLFTAWRRSPLLVKQGTHAGILDPRVVFHCFRDAAHCLADGLFVELLLSQSHERLGAIESFGHAGRLAQVQPANRLHISHHLSRQALLDLRQSCAHDRHFLL